MFHAGGGLVRERQPGEEVTQEKGWVTDEEAEHSETEGSEEEVIPVVVKAEDVVERFESEQETMEEAEILAVEVGESTMDLIHEAEEVANTDLLKLEISLAEKEIPQAPVSQVPTIQAKEEVVEAEVLSAQEFEPIGEVVEQKTLVVALSKDVEQQAPREPVADAVEQAPEQLVMSLEQATEQEPVTEVIARREDKIAEAVLVSEPQLELVFEPTHPEPLSLTSVMDLLEPTERKPLTFTAMMNALQPSKPAPVPSVIVTEVAETPMPEPFIPLAVAEIADVQQPESILEVKEVEASLLNDIPEEIQEEQERIKVDDTNTPEEIQEEQVGIKVDDTNTPEEIQEEQEGIKVDDIQEEQEGIKADDTNTPEEMQVDIKASDIDILREVQEKQENTKTDNIEQQMEAEIQEALVEVEVEVEETKTLSEESSLEDEAMDISPNKTIGKEPEVQEIAPVTQPPLPPSIPEPTIEAQDVELTKEIVEKVLPIRVQVTSPPQETPVLAISEKHSEQLFDDEYDETELNEDEEPEVELEHENLKLEGSLESTPSHMFKLTLPIPPSVNSPPSTVALCVKPEQTLLDLQKLIQLELLYTLAGSQHISFTTQDIEPPERTTDIVSKPDSTGFAINDRESAILRRPSYSDPSKYSSKPTCISTRWSLSTEIGAFIGDAVKSQYFTIGISYAPDKPPSTNIRISLPSFSDRTLHLCSQLRTLTPNLSALSTLKTECDVAVQRKAQKRSILTLAMSGFACLLLPLLLITFAYLSQPGLHPSFRPPPGELRLSHPVTTYIAAGLADILLLAGFAYLWSVYCTTGRDSVSDLATVKKVYSERGFDVMKWEELQAENTRLRSEIRRVAAEYGVTWDDDEVEQTKEAGTAATAA